MYLYAAHLVHKKTEAAFGQFEKVKQFSSDNNWDYSPTDSRWHSWSKTKPISQILTGDLDHIQSIEQWFKERLDEWIALKQIVPPFFKLSKGGSALASEISSVE